MLLSVRTGLFNFSTSSAIAQKTFMKFTQKYSENLENFKKKVGDKDSHAQQVKKSTQKPYVHPYDLQNKRVFLGVANALKSQSQLLGAEQVSPHYEHFSFARRQAIIFFAGWFTLRFIANTPDFATIAESATYIWSFFFAVNYFYIEGKKFFLAPMLTRFYKKLFNLELKNVQTYWSQNVEVRVRNLMSQAKSQMQYKLVHGEYLPIRNNILLNFLINEQVAIKNHINHRTQSILKEVEQVQNSNYNKIINSVVQETLSSIDTAYNNNKKKIETDIFELALEGIAAGKMDYAKDPILPYVLQTISKTVEKFSNISEQDQEKMVALTQEQLAIIRSMDARARDEYLNNEPKIDGALRNNPTVSRILDGWGK